MSRNVRLSTSFLIALGCLVRARITPDQFLALYVVRSFPGSSYSDVKDHLGTGKFSTVYQCVVKLMGQGFVEDRRIVTSPKTPGDLYITPAGNDFVELVLSRFD